MTIGTSADILDRVKKLIPRRWFSYVAPNRDAIIGGIADSAAWGYALTVYAKAQLRISTAYGIWLDIISYDYLNRFIIRGSMGDDAFRIFIKATILQERVTRAGMVKAITTLTNTTLWIFEPWNTFDTGAYTTPRPKTYLTNVSNTVISNVGGLGTPITIFIGDQSPSSVNGFNSGDQVVVKGALTTVTLVPHEANGVWFIDVFRSGINGWLVLRGSSYAHGSFICGTTTQLIDSTRPFAQYGSMGYGVGQGGYGNMNLPGKAFMAITRSSPSGLPSIEGYGNTIAGYGTGSIEYISSWLAQIGITNAIIYNMINITKPTGTLMWVAIGAPIRGVPRRPSIFNAKNDTQNLAII